LLSKNYSNEYHLNYVRPTSNSWKISESLQAVEERKSRFKDLEELIGQLSFHNVDHSTVHLAISRFSIVVIHFHPICLAVSSGYLAQYPHLSLQTITGMPLCLVKHHGLKMCNGVEVKVHTILNSALVDSNVHFLPTTASSHSNEYLVVRGNEKGTQCLRIKVGHSVPGGPGPPGWGSLI
jgi:hypothetical protein